MNESEAYCELRLEIQTPLKEPEYVSWYCVVCVCKTSYRLIDRLPSAEHRLRSTAAPSQDNSRHQKKANQGNLSKNQNQANVARYTRATPSNAFASVKNHCFAVETFFRPLPLLSNRDAWQNTGLGLYQDLSMRR